MVILHILQDRHMRKAHHVLLSHHIPRKAEAITAVVIHLILQDHFICKTQAHRGDTPHTTHLRHIGKIIIPLTDFQWVPQLHLPYNLLYILVIHYIPKAQSTQAQVTHLALHHIPKARIHNGLHRRIDIAEVRNRRLLLLME